MCVVYHDSSLFQRSSRRSSTNSHTSVLCTYLRALTTTTEPENASVNLSPDRRAARGDDDPATIHAKPSRFLGTVDVFDTRPFRREREQIRPKTKGSPGTPDVSRNRKAPIKFNSECQSAYVPSESAEEEEGGCGLTLLRVFRGVCLSVIRASVPGSYDGTSGQLISCHRCLTYPRGLFWRPPLSSRPRLRRVPHPSGLDPALVRYNVGRNPCLSLVPSIQRI